VTDGRSRQVSLVGAVVAVVTIAGGTAAGLAIVPTVGSYLGMLLGGFLTGVTVEDRPVVESGLAAALAAIGVLWAGAFVGNGAVEAVTALGSVAPTALLTSTLLSFAVGGFGAHLGDDLRDGLTTPVETPPTGRATTGSTPVTPTEATATDEADTRSGPVEAESDRAGRGEPRESPERERAESESENLELERE
jgi:hypothetical protein